MSRVHASLGALSILLADGTLIAAPFTGTVVDADSKQPIPARVYINAADGEWFFVETVEADKGSALPYREQWVPMEGSVEKHTTVSADPFRVELEPGRYTVTVERGKEYFPLTAVIEIADQPVQRILPLKRWVNLASMGWFSGETHVHRRVQELPNVMLAEDLNVAFPVTFWTVDAFAAPGLSPSPLRRQGPSPFGSRQDRGSAKINVDSSHVIFPRNTEYEVFNVGSKRHVLGALFILNHQSVFNDGMPPVASIAEQAHREGALLDLDKHSWPWSLMLVPIAGVDLFELSNNSVWRTKFGFRKAGLEPAPYMNVERNDRGMTEWGWLNFGFETYYTLLNCGFRLKPTAGTASGVHPVPLGHSRVYVHTGEKFDADRWFDNFRAGRSFVTTGPMLFATLNGEHPGQIFRQPASETFQLKIKSVSDRPVERIEVIINGKVAQSIQPGLVPQQAKNADGAWTLEVEKELTVFRSSWITVRTMQPMPDGRKRFAHTSPWHVEIPDQPLHPREEETDFLIQQVKGEIERNRSVLPAEALAEFQQALQIYEAIAERAAQAKPITPHSLK